MSMRTLGGRFVVLAAGVVLVAALVAVAVLLLRPGDPLRTEVVQFDLEHPWDIAFTDEGLMVVTERAGWVSVFASGDPGAERLDRVPVPDVRAELESGLMGVAVVDDEVVVCASRDPDGDGGEPWQIELLRAPLAADGTLGGFTPIPLGPTIGGPRHQGCAVEADADGVLWVSIGDANQLSGQSPAQDPSALNGKILRLRVDGSPGPGNPTSTVVYSLGHRNPQGIAIRPDGLVLAAEHGTNVDDEVNLIVAGGNYGYPCFTGASTPGPRPNGCGPATDYLGPAWASGAPTLATSGATFLIGSAWGGWEGDLIVSTLKEEDLRRFGVSETGEVTFVETLLDRRFGRLRAVVIGPDGALYVSSSNGPGDRIIRVTRAP